MLAGTCSLAHAQTGQITYVATAVSFSPGFANGGSMTVTYSPGNDATINPASYGSAWPSPFTMTFSSTDVIPTDAFTGTPNLIFTSYSQQNESGTSAGLTRVKAELKIDWQSGMTALQKNNNYDETTFPTEATFTPYANSIYSPSIIGGYTTPGYVANSNFVSTSEYAVSSTSALPTLSGGFTYENPYSWGMANTGSAQGSNSSSYVTNAAKNYSFDQTKQSSLYKTDLTTISAEQMFALSDDFTTSTKTSGFGITNAVFFQDVVVSFSAVPEPTSALSLGIAGALLLVRRRRVHSI